MDFEGCEAVRPLLDEAASGSSDACRAILWSEKIGGSRRRRSWRDEERVQMACYLLSRPSFGERAWRDQISLLDKLLDDDFEAFWWGHSFLNSFYGKGSSYAFVLDSFSPNTLSAVSYLTLGVAGSDYTDGFPAGVRFLGGIKAVVRKVKAIHARIADFRESDFCVPEIRLATDWAQEKDGFWMRSWPGDAKVEDIMEEKEGASFFPLDPVRRLGAEVIPVDFRRHRPR